MALKCFGCLMSTATPFWLGAWNVSGDCCASLSCGGSFLETLETFGRWDILDNGVLFYLVLNRLTIRMCNYCDCD